MIGHLKTITMLHIPLINDIREIIFLNVLLFIFRRW